MKQILVLLLLMTSCAPRSTHWDDPTVVRTQEKRLFELARPILLRSVSEETNTSLDFGFTLSDDLTVQFVHPNSSARKEGLKPGDKLLMVGSRSCNDLSRRQVEQLIQDLETSKVAFLDIAVRRGRLIETFTLQGSPIVNCPIMIVDEPQIKAVADGKQIFLSTGLMDTLQDSEVQYMIARALAINLLHHIQREAALATQLSLTKRFTPKPYIKLKEAKFQETIRLESKAFADRLTGK